MPHKCNREDCPRDHVNGPKVKCVKCKTTCFLRCFGFVEGPKIDGEDTVKSVIMMKVPSSFLHHVWHLRVAHQEFQPLTLNLK